MPEQVTKWKDASGKVHDTFEDCIVGEIACLIGKVGTGDASFADAIARKILEQAEGITDQLELLKEYMDVNPSLKERVRKKFGPPMDVAADAMPDASDGPAPLSASSASLREPVTEAA